MEYRTFVESRPVQISVCIPAHNEALTIKQIIENVLRISDVAVREILVCANGCTDQTVDIVTELAEQHRKIRLLIEEKASKINAWNRLVREATSDIVVFFDADITFECHSIAPLVQASNHPNTLVASGVRMPDRNRITPERRFTGFIMHPLNQDYVYGGYYAFRKSSLLDHFRSIGLNEMPDSISEDIFLTVSIPKNQITIIPEAVAYFTPPSKDELVRYFARGKAQLLDMQRRFPDLYARFKNERAWDSNAFVVYLKKCTTRKKHISTFKGTFSAIGKRCFIFYRRTQFRRYVELLLSQPKESAMAHLTRSQTSRTLRTQGSRKTRPSS